MTETSYRLPVNSASVFEKTSGDVHDQLGFGTSTDQPAIYTGPSLHLGPMLRVGGGYALNPDTGGFYLSLSLSLDGIPLFQ